MSGDMSLFTYFTKSILSNQRLWIAGVAQMFLWLFLIAYVFSGGHVTATEATIIRQTSVWYGYITLAVFAVLAMTLAAAISYATYSLAYSFKFTKLTPVSYISNLIASSSVLGIFLSLIMIVATFVIFSSRFGFSLLPSEPLMAIGISAIAGIFEFSFGAFLVLVIVNYLGLQSQGPLNFFPVMLSILLGLSQAFAALPKLLIYTSPFNEIESLLYQAYSGQAPHLLLSDSTTAVLSWEPLLLGLIAWIALLVSVDAILLKRLKPRQVEEGRQI